MLAEEARAEAGGEQDSQELEEIKEETKVERPEED